MEKITIPENVRTILKTLNENGFEAYAVGGCVRDSLMGRIPNDWDITTSALPLEVKGLFRKTVDTGIQHGTVTVLLGGGAYEVTTYRLDGEYEDSRHPKTVEFTSLLSEDLRRRDFTINAMAANEEELVDLFGGREDLEAGIIRCVGDANERFSEDALRILRAVRFAAQLGFSIEEKTMEAICEKAGTLEKISQERIQAELVKLVTSDNPGFIRIACKTGITAVILPELQAAIQTQQNNPHHSFSVGEHMIRSMDFVPPEKHLRLAMLFHDIGKPLVKSTDEEGIDHFYGHGDVSAEMAREILRRLKFDNETVRKVTHLIRFHDYRPDLTEKAVRRMMNRVGEELLEDVFTVQRADIEAQSGHQKEEKLGKLSKVQELVRMIQEKHQCVSLKQLSVTGRDLIADGMAPGREIGRVLDALLKDVLEMPEHNTKEYLLALSRTLR